MKCPGWDKRSNFCCRIAWSSVKVIVVVAAAPRTTDSFPPRTAVKRFRPGDDAGLRHLEQYGFTVIQAAHSTEVSQCISLFWDFMESLGAGINRSLPRTWRDDRWPALWGRISGHGMPQSQFMWTVRSLPGVQAAFASIFKTDDLLVSLDSPIAIRAGDVAAEGPLDYHLDQHPATQPDLIGVQGLLNLIQGYDWSPALGLALGSDKMFPSAWIERYGKQFGSKRSFVQIPASDEDARKTLDSLHIVPLLLPGDLLLWRSHMIHTFVPACRNRLGGRVSGLHRLAALIAMEPRARTPADSPTLGLRHMAVCNGLSSKEFWPHLCNLQSMTEVAAHGGQCGPGTFRFRTQPPAWLTAAQWRLVGSSATEAEMLARQGCPWTASVRVEKEAVAARRVARYSMRQT